MKKINVFLLILTITVSNFYQAQELDVIYEVKFKPSYKDTLREKELMTLKINTKENKSIFQSLGNDQIFSVNKKATQITSNEEKEVFEKKMENFSPEKSSFNFIISKDPISSSYLVQEKIDFKKYQTKFIFPSNQWKITGEHKNIKGYLCKKAEINFGGRVWQAYYTAEIPISDGPYKFYGLPGLILEISSLDNDYSFLLKSLEKKTSTPDWDFERGIIAKPEQILRLKQQYINDPAASIKRLTNNNGLSYVSKFNGKESSFNNKDLAKEIENETAQWQNSHNNYIEKGAIWLQ